MAAAVSGQQMISFDVDTSLRSRRRPSCVRACVPERGTIMGRALLEGRIATIAQLACRELDLARFGTYPRCNGRPGIYLGRDRGAAGQAVRGVQPGRKDDRAALRRNGARPCPLASRTPASACVAARGAGAADNEATAALPRSVMNSRRRIIRSPRRRGRAAAAGQ